MFNYLLLGFMQLECFHNYVIFTHNYLIRYLEGLIIIIQVLHISVPGTCSINADEKRAPQAPPPLPTGQMRSAPLRRLRRSHRVRTKVSGVAVARVAQKQTPVHQRAPSPGEGTKFTIASGPSPKLAERDAIMLRSQQLCSCQYQNFGPIWARR